jgi:inner membrane protein
MLRGITRVARAGACPAVLLAAIGLLDLAAAHLPPTVLLTGLLDEPAHLATAALLLLAAGLWRPARDGAGLLPMVALASAVLIDVDHIPLYLGVPGISAGGRPFSHSLVTPAIAAIAAAALSGRGRTVASGIALGTLLHFVRDVATGPGLPLAWPMTTADVRLPMAAYAAVLGGAAALASWRSLTHRTSTVPRTAHLEPRVPDAPEHSPPGTRRPT